MYASRARDCHAGYTQTRRVYLSIRNVQPIWDITLIPFDPPPHPSPRQQRRKILHNVGVSTGTPDFYRDLFFNAPRNDSLRKHTYIYTCVYIRTNIKNERDGGREKSKGNGGAENGEFGGSSVRKGKEDGGARLRWPPHGENKFRSSSPLALDTHYIFPEYGERQDTRMWREGSDPTPSFARVRGHLSHLSSTGNAPRMCTPPYVVAYTDDDIRFLKARCVTETQLFRRSQSRSGISRVLEYRGGSRGG